MERFQEKQDALVLYANDIKRFLICFTRNEDLAEELTQETLYQAVKSIHRYQGSCKISVWLCQIAKHLYYDYLKKEAHHPMVSVDELLEQAIEIPFAHAGPEDQFILKEENAKLWDTIDELEEPYRSVFLLRAIGEHSFRMIGDILEKRESWARVTYYRARLKLMERIRGEHDKV